ncbi:MAG: DUF3873 domain-containing protein [Oscillospiraceae bacterium]|jgi:hypothetical protein|nr:DUF3873 domain-containing protein [Oscillospiraceae bacterium]
MLDPSNLNNGEEQYERYTPRVGRKPSPRYQYDYRDYDGELFSCTRKTLDECHAARKEWLVRKGEAS